MWATRGVREPPAHRQSAFLLIEVLRPGQNHRALNSLQCPDDGNARRQKMWEMWIQPRQSSRVGGGAEQTENSSSSMPFFFFICHNNQQSVGTHEFLAVAFAATHR